MMAGRLKGIVAAVLLACALAVVGCSRSGTKSTDSSAAAAAEPKTNATATASPKSASPAERAIAQARAEKKYAFILFYRPGEQASETMRDTFRRAEAKLRSKAGFTLIDVSADTESRLIEQYGVRQAPLPLTLVTAPNGAVVNAFTKPVEEKALAGAFVSPRVAEVSKALQDRKLVALCLQGAGTNHNEQSKQAVQEFVADTTLGGQAVLIIADPGAEKGLLGRCGMQAAPAESTVVLLVPPGNMIASVAGATTKDILMAKLQAALASCGSGCGPSGCGP
jgi:hypothetical protein